MAKKRKGSKAPSSKAKASPAKLEKAASNEVPLRGLPRKHQGYDGLVTSNGVINEACLDELKWPRSITTYKMMSLDPTIASVNNAYALMIARAPFTFEAPEGASEASIEATEFLNYCKDNMIDQTFDQFKGSALEYMKYGFSIIEKNYTTVKKGKWKGKLKWESLNHIGSDTVHSWEWDGQHKSKIKAVIQVPNTQDVKRYGVDGTLKSSIGSNGFSANEVRIDRSKFMLFRYNPIKNNPQGTSPLDSVYTTWKYMQGIKEYQAIGIGKDFGGVPVMSLPVETIVRAQADPSSDEAKLVAQMESQAEGMHSGDSTYIVEPVHYDEKGKNLYGFRFESSKGANNFDITQVIEQKQNEIFVAYLATLLQMGTNSNGSFALSDNMGNLMSFAIEAHLDLIKEQIDRDLIPQSLALNGWLLEEDDMPKVVYGEIAKRDIEVLSKALSRVISVGAVTVDTDLDNAIRTEFGLPTTDYDTGKRLPAEFLGGNGSAIGDDNGGTSGTGDSQSQDTDTESNKENNA